MRRRKSVSFIPLSAALDRRSEPSVKEDSRNSEREAEGESKRGRERERENGKYLKSDWPTGTGVVYPIKTGETERVRNGRGQTPVQTPVFTTPWSPVQQQDQLKKH